MNNIIKIKDTMTYEEYLKYPNAVEIDGKIYVFENEFSIVRWCYKGNHAYKEQQYYSPEGSIERECICQRESSSIYRDLETGTFYKYKGFGTSACGNFSINIYTTYYPE